MYSLAGYIREAEDQCLFKEDKVNSNSDCQIAAMSLDKMWTEMNFVSEGKSIR